MKSVSLKFDGCKGIRIRQDMQPYWTNIKDLWINRGFYFSAILSYFCAPGEMAEWSNAADSKSVVRHMVDRGFESLSLRFH